MSDVGINAFNIRPYPGLPGLLKEVCGLLFGETDSDVECIYNAIIKKRQTAVIAHHLDVLGPVSCIVEREYVDRDFMDDYAHYYSRCFKSYSRMCCRLHFFGKGADDATIRAVLCGIYSTGWESRQRSVSQAYLGFVVCRPLPSTIFGKVCVRPVFGEEAASAATSVMVHLFGAELEVRTVPFQEQDSVVAACATSALWSAFQITGRRLNHRIPSPNRITRMATEGGGCESRPFPSKGLTIGDVGRAIFRIGLSQQSLSTKEQALFRAEAYAYLKLGLPVVLCGTIREPGQRRDSDNWHAVTAIGFELASGNERSVSCKGVFLRGAAVSNLFCNDDRIGPFFKFEGEPENRDDDNQEGKLIKFKTYKCKSVLMSDGNTGDDCERFTIKSAFVPVYHKLRIGFTDVFDALSPLNVELVKILEDGKAADTLAIHRLTWDLYIAKAVDLKQRVKYPGLGLAETTVSAICCSPMPKYLWVVSALEGDCRLGTFLVDATGIAQDLDVFMYIDGEDKFKSLLYAVARSIAFPEQEDYSDIDTEEREKAVEYRDKYLIEMSRNPFVRRLISMMVRN